MWFSKGSFTEPISAEKLFVGALRNRGVRACFKILMAPMATARSVSLTDPANWLNWPIAMVPVAMIGFVLALRVWHTKPKPKIASAAPAPVEEKPSQEEGDQPGADA